MRELASRGVAIVMISSDMEEILENSDRIAVMHDGRITGILDQAACTEEAVMRLAVAG
jgi:ribose transport system ATP-binding protein